MQSCRAQLLRGKFNNCACMTAMTLSLLWITTMIRADDDAKTPAKTCSYKLELSGDDSYVRIPDLRYDGSHPITIEAIATPYAWKEQRTRACVVGNVELSGLALHYAGERWMFHFNEGRADNAGYASVAADEQAKLDKPVHLAGVFDGKQVMFFVNGKLQKRVETTTNPHVISISDFFVGADPNKKGEPHQFFKGTIDEVRISKVARYKADFTPEKEKFQPDDDTLVLYHFDEGEGETARDSSGHNVHGMIHGAKWLPEKK